jgi:hypothetical protein
LAEIVLPKITSPTIGKHVLRGMIATSLINKSWRRIMPGEMRGMIPMMAIMLARLCRLRKHHRGSDGDRDCRELHAIDSYALLLDARAAVIGK